MPDQNLLNYIKNQQAQEVPKEQIATTLLVNGWKREMVEEAFDYLEGKISSVAAVALPSVGVQNNFDGATATGGGGFEVSHNNTSDGESGVALANNVGGENIKTENLPQAFSNQEQGRGGLDLPKDLELKKEARLLYEERKGVLFGVAFSAFLIYVVSSILVYPVFFVLNKIPDYLFLIIVSLPSFAYFASFSFMAVALSHVMAGSREKIGIIEAYKRSFKNPLATIWTMFWVLVPFVIGLIFSSLFVLILSASFIFIPYIFVMEGRSGFGALVRNIKYLMAFKYRLFSAGFQIFLGTILLLVPFSVYFVYGLSITFPKNEPSAIELAFISAEAAQFVYFLFAAVGAFLWIRHLPYLFVLYNHVRHVYDQKVLRGEIKE